MFWGLIYKTLWRIHTKCCARTNEDMKYMCAKKNILINKTWNTTNAQFPFINPRTTWKYAHMDQPPYPTPSTPTFNHKRSMQHTLWCTTANHEHNNKKYWQRNTAVCGWSGGYKAIVKPLPTEERMDRPLRYVAVCSVPSCSHCTPMTTLLDTKRTLLWSIKTTSPTAAL